MFDVTPTSLSQIKAGKLRPLGVTTTERLAFLPEVPTIDSFPRRICQVHRRKYRQMDQGDQARRHQAAVIRTVALEAPAPTR